MANVLEELELKTSRLYQDVLEINSQLDAFKAQTRSLDRTSMESISVHREHLTQILVDISVLLPTIISIKKETDKLIRTSDAYSLLPKKRAIFEELDVLHSTYRNTLYGLKEVSQELRDVYLSLTELNKNND